MTDFFISYTSADDGWAEWIAWTLEEAGFKVLVQKWDFVAGSNFILEMQKSADAAQRTIAVLSPDYLKSRFAAPEWAAAFANDPEGMKRILVPVRVRECAAEGLLRTIVCIDLVGLDEDAARNRLLEQLAPGRRKPTQKPSFPGASAKGAAHPAFPGPPHKATSMAAAYQPKLRRVATDLEKRRTVKDTFDLIRETFQRSLEELKTAHSGLDYEFTSIDATKFTAEIFLDGKSRCVCKIWTGGMFGGNDIAYAEGRHMGDNALNEALTLKEHDGTLLFNAMMKGLSFGHAAGGLDLDRLTPANSAEYYWRRFVSALER